MTRPEMRGPRPGEMLRQAATRGSASAREATPWRSQALARGLSALDRQQILLDQRAWGWVQEARAEIEQARQDIAGAKDVLAALGTAETDEDITLALANYLAIDPAEVSFIGSMSDAVVAQIVITDDIVTENMIATGAVTADALNIVSTSGTGHSWRLDSTGLIAMRTASQEAMHVDSGGIRMWDESGDLTVRINGVQNLFEGSVRTVKPGGGRGVIVANDGTDNPGVWLTSTGGGGPLIPGIRLVIGATPADDRLEIQRLWRLRFSGWRAAVMTASTTNQRGAARGPGQLSHSVNRDAPFTTAQESIFMREDGFYTVTFHAYLSVRPSASRAFLTLVKNAGTEARQPFAQEDFTTLTWFGWLASGDRLDFTSYFEGTGNYGQVSTISINYHGQ